MKRLLIDGDILRYRYGFAAQKAKEMEDGTKVLIVETEDKVYEAIKWGIVRMLRLTGCSEYVVYLSGKDNFRLKIDPEYKANRKDMEKPYHYSNITNYLIECHDAVVVDNYEADDALAIDQTETMVLRGDLPGRADCDINPLCPETVIASVDKDMLQVQGWHFNVVKETLCYVDEIEAAKNFWSQMLQGDRTDNVTGIRGIGPVKAAKLVDGCSGDDDIADLCYRLYRDEFGETEGPIMFDKNWQLLHLLRTKEELEAVRASSPNLAEPFTPTEV